MDRAGFIVVGLTALVLLACEQPTAGGAAKRRNVYYDHARKALEERDFQRAATLFQRALWVDPELAQAHLELALLYDDKLHDPIGAIYHYRRYLELRPSSEKRQWVEDCIDRAKISLVARLPQSPVVDPALLTRLQNEKAALVQENMALQARVMELEKELAKIARQTGSTTPVSGSGLPPSQTRFSTNTTPDATSRFRAAGDLPHVRQHVVQKGDTLQSIALRYYGTRAAWDRIYQANRAVLADKDQLKVGQTLAIP